MWLFAVFIAVPLIEIALFIKVGGWLTLWPTLAIVLFTGILGTALMRWQGRQVLIDLQNSAQGMGNPVSPLVHGALILLAGVLLLTPGFFTDTVGLLLMIPKIRSIVIERIGSRIEVQQMPFGRGKTQARPETVIEGEFVEVDDGAPRQPGTSGWTRH